MFEHSIRRIIGIPDPTVRFPKDDPVLGWLVPSDEQCWEVRVAIGLRMVGFKIGGEIEPSSELIAHAREIVCSFPEFSHRIEELLASEAERFGPLSDEIAQLEVENICLFWPARPDDGMIYFSGPDENRLWRCDYIGRVPVNLGFDR